MENKTKNWREATEVERGRVEFLPRALPSLRPRRAHETHTQPQHTPLERVPYPARTLMYSNYSDELRAPPRGGDSRGHAGVGADDVAKRVKDPILKTVDWAKNRPPKEKAVLAGGAAVLVR